MATPSETDQSSPVTENVATTTRVGVVLVPGRIGSTADRRLGVSPDTTAVTCPTPVPSTWSRGSARVREYCVEMPRNGSGTDPVTEPAYDTVVTPVASSWLPRPSGNVTTPSDSVAPPERLRSKTSVNSWETAQSRVSGAAGSGSGTTSVGVAWATKAAGRFFSSEPEPVA